MGIGVVNTATDVARAVATALDDQDGSYTKAQGATNLWTKAGIWQHICGTFESSTSRTVYLNGVAEGTGVGSEDVQANNIQVGSNIDSHGISINFSQGLIDDVRIYNRTLTPDEIKRLYNLGGTFKVNQPAATNGSLSQGLVGYWSFDYPDMAGITAFDRSGQGNNGTLTNGPVKAIGKLGQALDFNGVDSDVNLSNPSILNDIPIISVSAWIYPRKMTSSSGNGSRILTKRSSSGVGWTFSPSSTPGSGPFFLVDYNGATNLQRRFRRSFFTTNSWQHVSAVWDGSSSFSGIHVYVNGRECLSYGTETSGDGSRQPDTTNPLYVGLGDTLLDRDVSAGRSR
jgi:Concanavalin A-like lectin/glucanases superfamily